MEQGTQLFELPLIMNLRDYTTVLQFPKVDAARIELEIISTYRPRFSDPYEPTSNRGQVAITSVLFYPTGFHPHGPARCTVECSLCARAPRHHPPAGFYRRGMLQQALPHHRLTLQQVRCLRPSIKRNRHRLLARPDRRFRRRWCGAGINKAPAMASPLAVSDSLAPRRRGAGRAYARSAANRRPHCTWAAVTPRSSV